MGEELLTKILKKITRKLGFEIKRYFPDFSGRGFVSLKPENGRQGDVLLSYGPFGQIDSFLLKEEGRASNTHTNYWESLQMARTFLNIGYAVDIVSYLNEEFSPQKRYSFFIGARTNFEKFVQRLNEDCLKVVHLDMAHWLFNNSAAYKRCLALQQRRGVTVRNPKMCEPNWAIEYADCATILGNKFTISTYHYARKPIYPIPISTCAVYPRPEDKDFESCRKNFLWFGSSGLVHKGLDLVLDAFIEMPDYHLTVCGPIGNESDFETAYHRELYQTPNIHTVGWIDVNSQQFVGILNNCVGLIYPSCAEGQSGAVVNCLHAGLIPVISYESGVDIDNFGVILRDCSVDEIKSIIKKISNLAPQELKSMALNAWEFARANHTREKFAEEYKKAMLKIIAELRNRKYPITVSENHNCPN